MAEIALCQVKAFGDLVIAVGALSAVTPADRERVTLLIGSHLQELAAALVPPVAVRVAETGETGVPAIFDVRKAGVPRALASAVTLRRAIDAARLPAEMPLLFDQAAARERWVSGRHRAVAAARGADNIYSGWRTGLAAQGITLASLAKPARRAVRTVVICPGSRIAAKNLEAAFVAECVRLLADRGFHPKLILLQGERPDLEASGLPHTIVPRSFQAMIDAVRSADAVIGADSMPAHIAEWAGRPVHVVSPVPNTYWLPGSAFQQGFWSLMQEGTAAPALTRFLDHLGSPALTPAPTGATGAPL